MGWRFRRFGTGRLAFAYRVRFIVRYKKLQEFPATLIGICGQGQRKQASKSPLHLLRHKQPSHQCSFETRRNIRLNFVFLFVFGQRGPWCETCRGLKFPNHAAVGKSPSRPAESNTSEIRFQHCQVKRSLWHFVSNS